MKNKTGGFTGGFDAEEYRRNRSGMIVPAVTLESAGDEIFVHVETTDKTTITAAVIKALDSIGESMDGGEWQGADNEQNILPTSR